MSDYLIHHESSKFQMSEIDQIVECVPAMDVLVRVSVRHPGLPTPLKFGAGAKVGQTIYVGLGTAGKVWFSMDLSALQPVWKRMADFPGKPREQAVALAIGQQIYVFGGAGVQENGGAAIAFDEVYRFDPASNTWSQLPTRSPLGLLGSAAVSPDGLRAVFLGGVNKAIFDGFSRDLADAKDDLEQHRIRRAYMEMRPQDYFFTSDVLAYAPDTNSWQSLGRQPHAATVGSGVALKLNEITLINGEIKPGLRSYEVKRAAINTSDVSWLQVPDLVPGHGQQIQEGLAGVFAGYCKDVLLVAGGTNFPGAWARIQAGNNYAHEGLKKKWYTDIYALVEGRWRVAGRLPTALAYGLTFETDDGLLLIGGEQAEGGAMQTVLTLAWCQSGVQGLTDHARERVVHTSN